MTLSDLSYYIRRFGPFAIVGFIVLIILYVIISVLITAILNRPEQTVYTPPFGNLQLITFSQSIDYPPNVTFTIDNIEGRPVTPAQELPVFYIPSYRTRLGYQQSIAFMARAVGINTEETRPVITDTTATYADDLRSLEVDITNYNFSYELDYKKRADIFENTTIPPESDIIEEARSFLRQMNKLDTEFTEGQINVIYHVYNPETQEIIQVDSPAEANIVEVDYFLPNVDSYPSVSPKFFNSQNFVTMVFIPEGTLFIKAQVKHFPKEFETQGSYPLKSGDQAWEELTSGKGIIASPAKGSTNIVVKNMFLAYYEPEEYQEYLMPVYVFLGENDFAAYVSAIDDQYIESVDGIESSESLESN